MQGNYALKKGLFLPGGAKVLFEHGTTTSILFCFPADKTIRKQFRNISAMAENGSLGVTRVKSLFSVQIYGV